MKHWIQTAGARVLIVLALCAGSIAAADVVEKDPRVQREIERVVTSIVDSAASGDTSTVLERIGDLERAVNGNRRALLSQLAIYLAAADGTERAMGAALLFDHLGFSPRELVASIAPQLATEDRELRNVVVGLLATVDRPDGGEPDFRPYVTYLRETGIDPPAPLIEYMYGVAADEALSALADVYVVDLTERQSIERATRAAGQVLDRRSEAESPGTAEPDTELSEQLDRLSRSDAWWVRMFVREFVDASPEYASPALVARLESDEHPLVREGSKR